MTARKSHGTCTLWPKTNGNLIRCHLQGFGKNSGGFEKVDPGAENRVLAHENGPKRTFFSKSENSKPSGPKTYHGSAMP
jgi:hypothetical protein